MTDPFDRPPGQIPPPPPPVPGSPFGGQPYYGAGPYQHYPEGSESQTALWLGIVGLVGGLLCGFLILLSPAAWIVGQKEITAIDAGRRDPTNRGQANAGRIMGIIGTVLLILAILAIVVILAIISTGTST